MDCSFRDFKIIFQVIRTHYESMAQLSLPVLMKLLSRVRHETLNTSVLAFILEENVIVKPLPSLLIRTN